MMTFTRMQRTGEINCRGRLPDNDPCIPLAAPRQPTTHQACRNKPGWVYNNCYNNITMLHAFHSQVNRKTTMTKFCAYHYINDSVEFNK